MPDSQSTQPVVVITGADGLIGNRLIDRLKDNYRIVGLDIRPPHRGIHAEWIQVDLTQDEEVESAFRKVRDRFGESLASVIHLAAFYDFSGKESPLYQSLTVDGTRRILEQIQKFDIKQFVFSSSLLVMQPTETGRHLSEWSQTRAEWAYPQSKIEAENVIRELHGEIPYVSLRIAGVYDEMCHSLPLSQQISRIYESQLEGFVFPGDASCGQALIHLDDLAECFARVVELRGTLSSEELFLVAEPDVMSYAELQERIGLMIHGEEWPAIRIPKVVAKAGAWVKDQLASREEDEPFIRAWMVDLADDHYAVNISHARTTLGWDPRHRLRDTLPQIIANLHENPREWYEENGLKWSEDRDDLPVRSPLSRATESEAERRRDE